MIFVDSVKENLGLLCLISVYPTGLLTLSPGLILGRASESLVKWMVIYPKVKPL